MSPKPSVDTFIISVTIVLFVFYVVGYLFAILFKLQVPFGRNIACLLRVRKEPGAICKIQ